MSRQESITSQGKPSNGPEERDEPRRGAAGKVLEVADQARRATEQRVESARDEIDAAKARAAERVRKLGDAVRKIGEHMRIEEQVYISEHAHSASQRIDAVADYIADAELGSVLDDAEALARRRPVAVLGGAFLVGLAAGRFFKEPTPEWRQTPVLPERTDSDKDTTDATRGAANAASGARR